MSNKLITNNFKSHDAKLFIDSISSYGLSNNYYLFVGNHVPYTGGDTSVPVPNNSVSHTLSSAYSNMIAGKKITSADVYPLIRRINWTAGTVYDEYDDTKDLSEKNYYVVTNSGSRYYVFKCIYNNRGAASTVEPNYNDTSPDDDFFTTSDGYSWKYIYSVDKSTFNKFSTKDYMPVLADANVTGNAVTGSINNIVVTSGGQFYNNYYNGKFNFDDLTIGGDERKFNIGKDASSVSGFYYNSFIYITEGTGKGQYKRITDYNVSQTTKQITVESKFDTPLDATSRYEITPWVLITGNGTETINCVARALINTASSNSIYKIEILNQGAGYLSANARVSVSSNVGVTNTAVLRAVLPPYSGHGYDPVKEFNSSVLGISVKLANSESNTISTDNDFRTIGIIKSPLFSNVAVTTTKEDGSPGFDGSFLDNEGVLQVVPYKLHGTVDVNTTSTSVTGTNTQFKDSFTSGDYVLLRSGASHYISTVNAIASNTTLTLASNCGFTNAAATIYSVKVTATANVQSRAAAQITLTNLNAPIQNDAKLIGLTSSAAANVSSYVINNENKNFNTFNQLVKLYYTTLSGTLSEDELITQASSLGAGTSDDTSARYHSIDTTNKIVYVTNQYGIFNANSANGTTSGATINISTILPGDIIPGSGEVIYLEFSEPISRSSTQSETIKILVEY